MTFTRQLKLKAGLFSLCVAVLSFSLIGCSNPQNQIVGRWKVTSDTTDLVWDFAKDGSVSSGDIKGRYSFGSQKRMKLQTPFATFIYQVDIADGKMTWVNVKGTKTELTRVP